MGRNYANKIMAAAEVAVFLPVGTVVPTTEAQARELAPLRDDPEATCEAWAEDCLPNRAARKSKR